jgi:hypothetical protein
MVKMIPSASCCGEEDCIRILDLTFFYIHISFLHTLN